MELYVLSRKIITYLFVALSLMSIGSLSFANPIHPFEPEMTHKEMMDAAPELGWSIYSRSYSNITYEEHGAKADKTFDFAGLSWDVFVGDEFQGKTTYVTSLDLKTKFTPQRKSECLEVFTEVIKEFEKFGGPFGTEKGFKNPKSILYGNPYDGFEIEKVTEGSFARKIENSSKQYRYVSFREPSDGEFHRTLISALYVRYKTSECQLRVKAFIPFVWDDVHKRKIVPIELKRKFPGRYKEWDEE